MTKVSNKYLVITCVMSTLLLIGMLAFPFGPDQSIFEIGGEMIFKKGAIPYRDFIEMKQPLIFYIYGFTNWVFGNHEWSIRLFDVIYHIFTLAILFKLLRKVYQNEKIAILSVFLYTLYYTGGGYWTTAQTESFALLPLLIIASAVLQFEERLNSFKQVSWLGAKIGIAFFILISLKFTLAFALLGIFPVVVFHSNQNYKTKLRFILSTVFFAVSSIVLTGFAIYLSGGWNNFVDCLISISHYADIVPLFSIETYKTIYFHQFPENFIGAISATYILLSIIGIVLSFTKDLQTKKLPSSIRIFHLIILWQLAFGLLGVLFERKNFAYHYLRIAWTLFPFISIGIIYCFEFLRKISHEKGINRFTKSKYLIFVCILLCVTLFFSPFPKVIYQPIEWSWIAIHNDALKRSEKIYAGDQEKDQNENTLQYLKAQLASGDQLFFWGNNTRIYFLTGTLPPTLCIANTLFVSPWTPLSWKEQMMEQLQKARPLFFICEYNDSRYSLTGTKLDSYSSLLKWDDLRNYLFTKYRLQDSTSRFKIYSRIQ